MFLFIFLVILQIKQCVLNAKKHNMARNKFTSETGARAGKSRGKQKKTLEWEQLGEFITESGARRVVKYLSEIKEDEDFFEQFCTIVNYFKPKMQSSQIDAIITKPIEGITFDE